MVSVQADLSFTFRTLLHRSPCDHDRIKYGIINFKCGIESLDTPIPHLYAECIMVITSTQDPVISVKQHHSTLFDQTRSKDSGKFGNDPLYRLRISNRHFFPSNEILISELLDKGFFSQRKQRTWPIFSQGYTHNHMDKTTMNQKQPVVKV